MDCTCARQTLPDSEARERLGELRALHWEDIDEDAGLIQVQRSWDARKGEIGPKSFAGRRDVPIIAALRPFLTARRARCLWQPTGLALGSSKSVPFSYNGLYRRSAKTWQATGFARVTPHQARHSFASYLIAAGADVKAVTEIMGHASVRQSFDRYGHLLRDSHANTVTKDELARVVGRGRRFVRPAEVAAALEVDQRTAAKKLG